MAGISSSIKLTDQATGPLLSMANAANATANAFTRVLSACDSIMNTGGISELEKKTTQVGQKTDENTRKQEAYNQKLRDGGPAANGLLQKLERVAATYLTIQGIAKATALSDDLTQTTARLDMMNNSFNKINGTANETPDLVRNVYAAAQDARGAFGDMASVVARFGNNFGPMLPAPSRICSGGSKSLSGSETFTVTASHKLLTYFPTILSITKGTYIKCLRKFFLNII